MTKQVHTIAKSFFKTEIKNLTLLGRGENNINYKVTVGNKHYVIRINLHKEYEQYRKQEFSHLSSLPPQYGPRPIFLDTSHTLVPTTYMILEYIHGYHLKRWSKKHLKVHAEKLAVLHKKRKKLSKPFSLYRKVLKEIRGYQVPPELLPLSRKVKAYIKKHDTLFTSLKYHSFVHYDTCVTNILQTPQGLRYIDWEWSRYFDPVEDVVALYFSDCALPPWRLHLTPKRKHYFIQSYLKVRPDATLPQRADVIEVHMKFLELLYFHWKLRNFTKAHQSLPRSTYIRCITILQQSLENQFRDEFI